MTTLTLTDGVSRLSIDLETWDGDAYISISVESRGFSGRNDLHVLGPAFVAFCSDLLRLQKSLKGEARLTAVHPDDLDVCVKPADGLGHLSVVGSTGHHVPLAHTSYWHAVHFGFQIEPSQLDAAVRTPWVREHGE